MKTFSIKVDPLTNEEYWEVYLRGQQLLSDPLLNKASAFTEEERLALDLVGPAALRRVDARACRCERTLEAYRRKPDDLEKYIYLQGLMDRNEVLFYRLLVDNLTEMVPIVYTPTVGQACLQLSQITRRYRGVYLSPDNIGRHRPDLPERLAAERQPDRRDRRRAHPRPRRPRARTAWASRSARSSSTSPPAACTRRAACRCASTSAPTTSDCSSDPLYLGWRHPRLEGDEYWEFIEKFVLGVKRNFPEALVQWEDFAKHKAFTLLERYRERVLSFDDDIQGTGAVALAALMTAMRIKKQPVRRPALRHRRAWARPASASRMNIRAQLKAEGLSDEEARARIFAVDQPGLLVRRTRRACRSGSSRSRSRARPSRAGRSGRRTEIALHGRRAQREADGAHRRDRADRALQRRGAVDDGVLRDAARSSWRCRTRRASASARRRRWRRPPTAAA